MISPFYFLSNEKTSSDVFDRKIKNGIIVCMAIFEKKYRFTSNRHSRRGMLALIFGGISLVSFFLANVITIRNTEQMAERMGGAGFFATVFGIVGMVLGLISLKEEDVFPILPRIGFAVSLISVLLWGFLVYIGMM